MAVFRIEKTRDYTVMASHHLRNTVLSLKAKTLQNSSSPYEVELQVPHSFCTKSIAEKYCMVK